MNARVFLLVLVCSVFMSVWNSDQHAMNAALARKQRIAKPTVVAMSEAHRSQIVFSDVPLLNNAASSSIAGSSELEIVDEVSSQPEIAVAFFCQPVNSMILPVPFPVEIGALTSLNGSFMVDQNNQVDIVEPQAHIKNDDVDQVVVTELIDAHVVENDAWESPESLQLPLVDLAASFPPSALDADDAVAAIVPTEEELSIVVEPPRATPTLATDPSLSDLNAIPDTPQASTIAALPLESTGPTIPLPKDLASGTWTVMNQSGDVFKVTIERTSTTPLEGSTETFEQSFSLRTGSDGDRWCFIRSFADRSVSGEEKSTRQATTEFFSPIHR